MLLVPQVGTIHVVKSVGGEFIVHKLKKVSVG